MEERDLINFAAHGKLIQENKEIGVLISGAYHIYGYAPVKCNITPLNSDNEKQEIHIYPFNQKVISEILGRCEDGEGIWIQELTEGNTTHRNGQTTWQGIAKLFLKGDIDNFNATEGKIYFSAFIPSTPLAESGAHYIRSYDGTIQIENNDKSRRGVKWSTKLGEAELIDNYHYKTSKYEIDNATVRIQRSQINLEIKIQGAVSFKVLTTELVHILDDALWLISFLSRKRLVWYAGEFAFVSDKHEHKMAKISRETWLGYIDNNDRDFRPFELLISLDFLKEGFLQNLVDNYLASSYCALMKQAIIHLMMSYERGYFEAHLSGVYAAIECLVDGLSDKEGENDSYILPPQTFKSIIPEIKKLIESHINNQMSAKLIIKNIERLNKSSTKPQGFAEKLIKALNHYNVNYKILWKKDTNIKEDLREIRKRRDFFIHQGKLENFNAYYSDFLLLRTVCELWILKLLDYPDEKINSDALLFLKSNK